MSLFDGVTMRDWFMAAGAAAYGAYKGYEALTKKRKLPEAVSQGVEKFVNDLEGGPDTVLLPVLDSYAESRTSAANDQRKAALISRTISDSTNCMATALGASRVHLVVAENGSGPPRRGERMFSTVIARTTLVGRQLPVANMEAITKLFADKVLWEMDHSSIAIVNAADLDSCALADLFLAQDPPTKSAMYMLVSVRSSGMWFVVAHFDGRPPVLTADIRHGLRTEAQRLGMHLWGRELPEGGVTIAHPECTWGE